ncbi:cleavage and polyadenylation specificity factor subunit 6-like [Chamaea fasciata]|uniref:cleavage and polyadenylation specificity factor subunit 6-like n=1 Tax=Chamaea fasciata TaxID=190680 RepID=UPI00336A4D77
MPHEPGVAPGGSPLSPPLPGTPQKGAQPPPGSDSEQDSGFSDSGSEHLGRCERTDTEQPPVLGHAHPGPQPPGPARPLLLLLPAPPAAVAVAGSEGTRRCPPVPPPELSPCPRGSLGGALLAVLALRTGALLRHNRRTQGDIATLRRHTRLLARATRDPRVWPRLCHLLGPSGGPREPPGFGEGAGGQ